MTWGECKLATLRTMFANEGPEMTVDDSNQEYINAMPEKANEALQILAIAGKPNLKCAELYVERIEESFYQSIDLKEKLADYRAISDLMKNGMQESYRMAADRFLILPNEEAVYTIIYEAYPQKITAETTDETGLDAAPECAVLLPLYMASELYKEDELATATIWRNEFEDGLEKVRRAYEAQGGGMRVSAKSSTEGWW